MNSQYRMFVQNTVSYRIQIKDTQNVNVWTAFLLEITSEILLCGIFCYNFISKEIMRINMKHTFKLQSSIVIEKHM